MGNSISMTWKATCEKCGTKFEKETLQGAQRARFCPDCKKKKSNTNSLNYYHLNKEELKIKNKIRRKRK